MEKSITKSYKHKMHFCIFCKKEIARLAEHFIRRHKDEDVVKEILETKDKREKLWKWKTLRQQGDHFYNLTEHVGDRKIVKAPHRPSKGKKYFDCPKCKARLRTTSKLQHANVCEKIFEVNPKTDVEEIDVDIFNGLPEDLVNKIRKSTYLTSFLKQMFEAKDNNQLLRTMARDMIFLQEEIQKHTGENKPLSTFLTSKHVDDVIKTIKLISGHANNQEKKIMRYPYRAQRFCRLISHFSKFLTSFYSKRNMDLDVVETTKFMNAFQSDSEKLIRKQANRAIKIRKLTTPTKLPKTSDINVLVEALRKETPKLMASLEEDKNPTNWRRLAENVLCRLTIFNRRRGGAVEKMKIVDYNSTEVRLKTATEESAYNLSIEERDFLKDVRIVEILHKCDNVVPIFVTKELQAPMDLLLEYREFGDINEQNEYFFAASKKSLNPISGVRVLEKYREHLPEEVRKILTATSLRKHGATVAQLLDLTPQDKEEWAAHMGHSVLVHDKYYRKNEEVSAVLKTARILTAIDEGAIKYYKGKKIAEIPLKTSKGSSNKPSVAGLDDFDISNSKQESSEVAPSTSTATCSQEGDRTCKKDCNHEPTDKHREREMIASTSTSGASVPGPEDFDIFNWKEDSSEIIPSSVPTSPCLLEDARTYKKDFNGELTHKRRRRETIATGVEIPDFKRHLTPRHKTKHKWPGGFYSVPEYKERKRRRYIENDYLTSPRFIREKPSKGRKILFTDSDSDPEISGYYPVLVRKKWLKKNNSGYTSDESDESMDLRPVKKGYFAKKNAGKFRESFRNECIPYDFETDDSM